MREVRANVQKELELLRVKGDIGSPLAAEVEILASGDRYQALAALQDDLRFVLITSQARVVQVGSEAEEMVKVRASSHPKCPRCWHYRADVGADRRAPGAVRALRGESVRCGGAAHPCLSDDDGRCVAQAFPGGRGCW